MKGADYAVLRIDGSEVRWKRMTGQAWQTAKPTWHYKLANANIEMTLALSPAGCSVYLYRSNSGGMNSRRYNNCVMLRTGKLSELWEEFMDYARML